MNSRDLRFVIIIGAAVGLLVQPMIANLVDSPSVAFRIGAFIGFLVFAPLALFIAHLMGRIIPVLYQFAKFAAVGTLNSFIDVGVLNFLIYVTATPEGIAYSVFKAVSFLTATANSYAWNKYWTFGAGATGPTAHEIVKFYVIAAVGFLVNVGVASLVVNGLGRPETISPNLWANIGALCGILSAFLWNFLGYKYIVFERKDCEPRA